ncbi:MAG: UDP-N-acetylmuramoyl-L-alanyl-D-glutamate--2,6-diaminopimelate ligase [Bdellovibrionaceae bacterium]|nr:UDP-N-acetylmuramoyl-L-alanyl-D-glutamate--2,6-diaminopimelate ligase [Pseudobdellovibrionaceae bacterium]
MKFTDFLLNTYILSKGSVKGLKVSSISDCSQKVEKDSLFIAIKGRKTDGHNYLATAIEKGASVLLVKDSALVPSFFKGVVLEYTQLNLGSLLNQFYDFPSEKLFTVGVTGTNGKTSFCYLLEHLFQSCGWPTGVIGTVDQHFNQKKWSSILTTPSSADLFKRLNDFVKLSARAVAMEVSSIALDQNRVEGVDFKALIFSNLSQDHLDYHGSIENYWKAKQKLFLQAEANRNKNLFYLINQDDIYGYKLKTLLRKSCWTYGQSVKANFCFKIKEYSKLKTFFELKSPFGVFDFSVNLVGEYNVYNTVSALACAMLTGFKAEDCQKALACFQGVPGRLEKLKTNKNFDVFIDYAHTPQALSVALKVLKNNFKRLILVCGCGGDRDKKKRPLMAKIALSLSDHIFWTTDNPRYEDPQKIADSALEGINKNKKIKLELDREKAIKKAISFAKKGDCVLIAGKGHEQFQIVKDKRISFCDKTVALNFLKSI